MSHRIHSRKSSLINAMRGKLINLVVLVVVVPVLQEFVLGSEETSESEGDTNDDRLFKLQSLATKTLRSKGYRAEDYYLKVQNGLYTINLIRATNPLINGGRGLPDKYPVLFIHGLMTNANAFIIQNNDVRPQNYASYNVSSMSLQELNALLVSDPGSNSLVFTLLNFGYEVYLLNRRTARDSRRANSVISKEMNVKRQYANESQLTRNLDDRFGFYTYWDFSFDEQAEYDIPEAIRYALRRSRYPKLTIVGYSAGSTVTLAALIQHPELSSKVLKALLWAPAYDLAYFARYPPQFLASAISLPILPILSKIKVPFPADPLADLVSTIIKYVCPLPLVRPLLCDPTIDFIYGLGSSQLDLSVISPETEYFDSSSLSEYAQFLQSVKKKTFHYYDHYDPIKNLNRYGQLAPPRYDTKKITLETISLWNGVTDEIVNELNVDLTASVLYVPVKRFTVGAFGVLWNHQSWDLHKNINRALIIPSLKEIESNLTFISDALRPQS